VCDPEMGGVLRTLRVDLDGQAVLCGEDGTHQLVSDLTPGQAGVQRWIEGEEGPAGLAERAATWLESELRRPPTAFAILDGSWPIRVLASPGPIPRNSRVPS
jgi:hypothetical protein